MAYGSAFVEVELACLDFFQLPLFGLYVLGDRFGGKEGLGTFRAVRQCIKALLRFCVEADGEGFCHDSYSIVYKVTQVRKLVQGAGNRAKASRNMGQGCGLRVSV